MQSGEMRDLLNNVRQKVEDIEIDLSKIEERVNNKVSFSLFTWVIGLCMFVLVGLQGVIWAKLSSLDDTTNQYGQNIVKVTAEFTGLVNTLQNLELVK